MSGSESRVESAVEVHRILEDSARKLDGVQRLSWQINSVENSRHYDLDMMLVIECRSEPGVDRVVVAINRRRGASTWSWSIVDGDGALLVSDVLEVEIGQDATAIEQFATFLSDAHAPVEAYLRSACG